MNRLTKTFLFLFLFTLSLTLLPALVLDTPLSGIWENSSRFIEFNTEGQLRIILKPYYGFVYEDTGWVQDSQKPRLQIKDELFLQYYQKQAVRAPTGAQASPGGAQASPGGAQASPGGAQASPGGAQASLDGAQASLDGFYLAQGLVSGIRLYEEENLSELFGWYFDGSHYYRIRYWKTDVRFKDVFASFTSMNGQSLYVPKFISFENELYTCITSTGKNLRNFEKGEYILSNGTVSFKPREIVFAETQAAYRNPIKLTISPDGLTFALGEPYLVRSKISDIDAEIKAHNGKTRPMRKPLLEFMDLDFHWEKIEEIRNSGSSSGL